MAATSHARARRSLTVEQAHTLIDRTIGSDALALVTSRLADRERLLLSGSLVDGLGNPRSDLDFYLVGGERRNSKRVQMALAGERYLDCERLTANAMTELADSVNRVPDDDWLATMTLSELDPYFRIAIAVQVAGDLGAGAAWPQFDREHFCAVLAYWADLQSCANAARARIAQAAGREKYAARYAHEAFGLALTAELARLGDGYPSMKWIAEKAQRTLGVDTPAYTEAAKLLTFFPNLGAYVDGALQWVAEHTRRRPGQGGHSRHTPHSSTVLVTGPAGEAVVTWGRTRLYALVPEDSIVVDGLLRGLDANPHNDLAGVPGMSPVTAEALVRCVAADLVRASLLDGGDRP